MQNRPYGVYWPSFATCTAWYAIQRAPTRPTDGAQSSFGSQPGVAPLHASRRCPTARSGRRR